MKDAFTAVGVEGSGHRLRAHYATMTAARIWDECLAMNGYRFDQTVMNMALDRLAEALGHSSVTTTVRHYIDMALLQHFGWTNRKKMRGLTDIWNVIVSRSSSLSPYKLALINRAILGLIDTHDDSPLEHILSMALDDPDVNP